MADDLDALGSGGTLDCDGHPVKVTNLDKVLFAGRDGDAPVTKRELIRYYRDIAPVLLPHLAGRSVNLNRFPNGVDRPGFWNKAVPANAPAWIQRWKDPSVDDDYYLVDRPATLVYLANLAAVELHPWTSLVTALDRPTYALFDIDPGPTTAWDDVVLMARLHRTALEHLGVVGFPKVTGQRGIQVWVPIEPVYSFGETRAWVETVSKTIGAIVPELVSWNWDVSSRRGLARLDFTQNALNKTLVAPYSVRPAPGAPVSAPITWDELDDPELRPDRWTIRTIGARLAEHGDLFAGALDLPQTLPSIG